MKPVAEEERQLRQRVRRLLVAWMALLALMFASLGSAYLRLGPWNAVAGLLIAAMKSAIVVWLFMGLARSGALLRLVAVLAAVTLALLFGLGSLDYFTRRVEPAPMQQPKRDCCASSASPYMPAG